MLLQLEDVNKIYGEKLVLSHVSLTIEDHDRVGLVGVNGCGKTTLLRLITGREDPDHLVETDGKIMLRAQTRIGYLQQMGGLDSEKSVIDEMRGVFADLLEARERMRVLEEKMQEDMEKYAEEYHRLLSWFEVREGYQIDVKIERILRGMGFEPAQYTRQIASFSGGEKTRLAIAKLLLEEPNLLILDEPTNHLDFKTVMWLEDYLKDYRGALLLVSHDRYFLDRLCTSICEIERSKLTRYKGNYTTFTQLKAESVARQWKEYTMQQAQIAKLEDYVARNSVRASTAKSAQSRAKQLDKIERIEKPFGDQKQAKLNFTYALEPPEEVLQVRDLTIRVGEGEKEKTLCRDVNFTVRRGEKWGIIGDNGVGKSTLLRAIQGKTPYEGRIRLAGGVTLSCFEQEGGNLHPEKSVIDEIHDRVPSWTQGDVRSLLGKVRITGDNVFKRVGVLSGGERAKLCFAIMMLEHGNVLILDEPTNHLDIAMKEVIESTLVEFTGTVICVSHDRYFLDRVADHILSIDGGTVKTMKGNFSSWATAQKVSNVPEEKVDSVPKKANNGANSLHRSKEERARTAQLRNKVRACEKQLDALQVQLDTLTEELSSEEVARDYTLMQEKCLRCDEVRQQMDEILDQMIALEEEMG